MPLLHCLNKSGQNSSFKLIHTIEIHNTMEIIKHLHSLLGKCTPLEAIRGSECEKSLKKSTPIWFRVKCSTASSSVHKSEKQPVSLY